MQETYNIVFLRAGLYRAQLQWRSNMYVPRTFRKYLPGAVGPFQPSIQVPFMK